MAPINSVDSDQEAAISGRLRRRYRPSDIFWTFLFRGTAAVGQTWNWSQSPQDGKHGSRRINSTVVTDFFALGEYLTSALQRVGSSATAEASLFLCAFVCTNVGHSLAGGRND